MNDARIAELVRQAIELDDLERSMDPEAAEPALRLTHAPSNGADAQRHRRRAVMMGLASGLAAAACVGVAMTAAFLAIMPGTPSHPATSPLAAAPERPTIPALPAAAPNREGAPSIELASEARGGPSSDEQCCVVIALVRDTTGGLRCVQWRQHDWDVQRVSGMDALDLKVAVPQPCMSVPQQVVLVAITGPTRSLPRTDESAASLASCILGSPRNCETDGMCFTGAAARCLPNDVSVKVETVAWNR